MKSVAKGLLVGMATFGLAMSGVAVVSSMGNEPIAVYATLEDDLGGIPTQGNQGTQSTAPAQNGDLGNALKDQQISQDDQSVANWIKNQRGMTGEQLNKASQTLSPITNMLGVCSWSSSCFIICSNLCYNSVRLVIHCYTTCS